MTSHLVRGSLTGAGGECRGASGLSLEVRDGGFVGVSGPATQADQAVVQCSGEALQGARFQVALNGDRSTTVTIAIEEIHEIAVRDRDAWKYVPTYNLAIEYPVHPGETASPPQPVCPGSSWMDPGTGDATGAHDAEWARRTRHALLIQGEAYQSNGSVAATGPTWINIGCAGSGVSKLRLLGFDPMDGRSTAGERQATLKMFIGWYCDRVNGTRQGTRLHALRRGAPGSSGAIGELTPGRAGPIESRWGEGGALCISHLRLWNTGDSCARHDEAEVVKRIQAECGIPACDETLPCTAATAGGDGATVWQTCTIDHVNHGGRSAR